MQRTRFGGLALALALALVSASPVAADDAPAPAGGDPALPVPLPVPKPDDPSTTPAPIPGKPEVTPNPNADTAVGTPPPPVLGPTPSWYEGKAGHKRLLHIGVAVGFGLTYVGLSAFGTSLAPKTCRWCEPPSFDRSVRNSLVWNNTARADLFSSIDAYILAPLVGFGLLYAADHSAGWARLMDDIIPVAETIAITQTVVLAIKYAVGRQRPDAHFDDTGRPATKQDNQSFPSGHSSLGFSITAAAGLICHWRHYWTEPYVWGAGIALSLSTEYLRMGADKHYLTDVVAGGALGVAGGLLIPRLMRQDIVIAPINNGVAVAGSF